MSQKLTSPARVGNTIFQTGVSHDVVVERAQREYGYHKLPKPVERPCGDFYPNASIEKECFGMDVKPCSGCMFNRSK